MVFNLRFSTVVSLCLQMKAIASICNVEKRKEEMMAYKRSVILALLAGSALCGLGGVSFAEDQKWGAPNVQGQPGYKEPAQSGEMQVHAPRTTQDPRLPSHPKHSTETESGH
jgi:hypothetical protein